MAWKNSIEKQWNKTDPAWFPDMENRALLQYFRQAPHHKEWDISENRAVVKGRYKIAFFIIYPQTRIGMKSDERAEL